jgi:diaminopimelate decarboxylase
VEDIVFTGVGKSDAELACAVPLGLKAINVESAGELDRVEALARKAGVVARVAIRVNPDIDAKSHPHISTGLKINKFGVPVDEADRLLAGLAARPALKLVAVHMHVGSQMTSLDPVRAAAARLAGFARQAQEAGITLEYLDAGGGLGISYDGGQVPSADRYAAALVDEIRATHLPIVVEPGRSIVGPAGVLLAQVVDIKGRTASSDFAIIDAGMTELMRPALYNGFHRIEPVCPREGGLRQYEIAGPVCESTDIVGRDRTLPPLAAGDLVAIHDTGAYGSAMASNYNRRPLPAEVLVDDGKWRVIRKRQTIDDMLAQEEP